MAMFNKWPKGNIPKPSILHSSVCTRSWHHKLSTNIHHAPDLCGLPQTVPRSTKEAVNLAAGDGERWFGQWDLFIWRNHRELSTHIFSHIIIYIYIICPPYQPPNADSKKNQGTNQRMVGFLQQTTGVWRFFPRFLDPFGPSWVRSSIIIPLNT